MIFAYKYAIINIHMKNTLCANLLGRNSINRVHIVITHVGTLGCLIFGGKSEGKALTTFTDHFIVV